MGRGMRAGRRPKKAGGGKAGKQQMAQMQAMQQQMEKVQDEIDRMEATASAGGGAVTATVTGKKEIKELHLDPDIVDPDDIEMLEDLVTAAVNQAMRKMTEISNSEMEKFTAGLGLPPGMI
ncbi:MAG: YbaB/EbfC family nucleoid-associated protein [Anaerovoracaceae bacterium]|jgi:DNA-binding YbaB/EbfC family protein